MNPTTSQSRLDSIDMLRGIVIVLMALDHIKGNIAHQPFSFVDLDATYPGAFLTRWITHFCAPVFVFLAGTGAFLFGSRGRSTWEVSWYLFSRGLFLVVLEVTVIRYAWFWNLDYGYTVGQVIWAIGASMIVLSVVVFLPLSFISVFGLAMIAFHNLADGVTAQQCGNLGWLWKILHTGEMIELAPGRVFHPMYPLVPWIGVMAVGYAFGSIMLLPRPTRRKEVFGLGLAVTALFVALRFTNAYGDHAGGHMGPWSVRDDEVMTVLSFINCQKYPPSLCYLLMTLGPALMLLSLLDRERQPGPVGHFFVVFGRVPLFFYILHWFVIKGLKVVFAYVRYGPTLWEGVGKEEYGYDLWVVYLVWIGVVLFFYPLCVWFAGVKRRSRAWWVRYL